jgi:hypothetical protein
MSWHSATLDFLYSVSQPLAVQSRITDALVGFPPGR